MNSPRDGFLTLHDAAPSTLQTWMRAPGHETRVQTAIRRALFDAPVTARASRASRQTAKLVGYLSLHPTVGPENAALASDQLQRVGVETSPQDLLAAVRAAGGRPTGAAGRELTVPGYTAPVEFTFADLQDDTSDAVGHADTTTKMRAWSKVMAHLRLRWADGNTARPSKSMIRKWVNEGEPVEVGFVQFMQERLDEHERALHAKLIEAQRPIEERMASERLPVGISSVSAFLAKTHRLRADKDIARTYERAAEDYGKVQDGTWLHRDLAINRTVGVGGPQEVYRRLHGRAPTVAEEAGAKALRPSRASAAAPATAPAPAAPTATHAPAPPAGWALRAFRAPDIEKFGGKRGIFAIQYDGPEAEGKGVTFTAEPVSIERDRKRDHLYTVMMEDVRGSLRRSTNLEWDAAVASVLAEAAEMNKRAAERAAAGWTPPKPLPAAPPPAEEADVADALSVETSYKGAGNYFYRLKGDGNKDVPDFIFEQAGIAGYRRVAFNALGTGASNRVIKEWDKARRKAGIDVTAIERAKAAAREAEARAAGHEVAGVEGPPLIPLIPYNDVRFEAALGGWRARGAKYVKALQGKLRPVHKMAGSKKQRAIDHWACSVAGLTIDVTTRVVGTSQKTAQRYLSDGRILVPYEGNANDLGDPVLETNIDQFDMGPAGHNEDTERAILAMPDPDAWWAAAKALGWHHMAHLGEMPAVGALPGVAVVRDRGGNVHRLPKTHAYLDNGAACNPLYLGAILASTSLRPRLYQDHKLSPVVIPRGSDGRGGAMLMPMRTD